MPLLHLTPPSACACADGLSPFSTECKSFLDGLGCKYEAVELGPEWFLLGPKASAMREELAATTGQSSNFVMPAFVPTDKPGRFWTKRAVAMLTQLSD